MDKAVEWILGIFLFTGMIFWMVILSKIFLTGIVEIWGVI